MYSLKGKDYSLLGEVGGKRRDTASVISFECVLTEQYLSSDICNICTIVLYQYW